jgi:DNA-binding transcriptional LysR family regulator
MDLRQLQYFLAADENRSFGRAADVLHRPHAPHFGILDNHLVS